MTHNTHYMRKGEDGDIVAVPANEWAKYRADGFDFSTEAEFNEQQAAAPEVPAAKSEPKKKRR